MHPGQKQPYQGRLRPAILLPSSHSFRVKHRPDHYHLGKIKYDSMNILHTIASMDAKAGGPTTCTFDLATGLNALGCRTDILTIASGNRATSSIQAPFIKTVPLTQKRLFKYPAIVDIFYSRISNMISTIPMAYGWTLTTPPAPRPENSANPAFFPLMACFIPGLWKEASGEKAHSFLRPQERYRFRYMSSCHMPERNGVYPNLWL